MPAGGRTPPGGPSLLYPQVRRPAPGDAVWPWAAAAVLTAIGLAAAWSVTRDLTWPPEGDMYRDLGAARAFLDGDFGGDSAYAGEARWYPPLVPAVVAVVSRLVSLPLPEAAVAIGPFVNLLGPLGIFILGRTLFGPWHGVGATAAYLFLGDPSVLTALRPSYSPWLWPVCAAQGMFFLFAAAYVSAVRRGGAAREALAGLLLGGTFLAHAAPGLVGAAWVTAHSVLRYRQAPGDGRRVVRRLFFVAATSLVVASPFLVPLGLRYGFRVSNHAPGTFAAVWGREALTAFAGPTAALAAVALLAPRFRPVRGPGAAAGPPVRSAGESPLALVALLFAVAASALAYCLAAQTLRVRLGVDLPQPVPSFHFLVYAAATTLLLAPVGLSRLVAAAAGDRAGRVAPRVAALVLVVVAVSRAHLVAEGPDARKFRADAVRLSTDPARDAAYRWASGSARKDDVVVADEYLSHYAVLPAGRKVVALRNVYSNPYVPFAARSADRSRAYRAAVGGRSAAFARVASRRGVDAVVVRGARAGRVVGLRPVFASGGVTVYRWERHRGSRPPPRTV